MAKLPKGLARPNPAAAMQTGRHGRRHPFRRDQQRRQGRPQPLGTDSQTLACFVMGLFAIGGRFIHDMTDHRSQERQHLPS
ncbi:MAG: hypothetical protein FD153_1958 [Rhodospirillaceae bacterium]|nr:MAG: hypothetical protein FD153_1958 [Rhodospirillaceae bacterium]